MSNFFRNANANEKRRQTKLTETYPLRRHSTEGGQKRPAPTDGDGNSEANTADPDAGPSGGAKEARTHEGVEPDTGTMSSDVEMHDQPTVANGGVANSSGGGMRGSAAFPVGVRQSPTVHTRVFNKQYNLRIFNRLNEYSTPTYGGVQYNEFIPNAHEIPCHLVSFYMSYAEMQRLRSKTKVVVKNASVQISNHTAIISYETNAAGTQIGNNNLGITMYQLDPNISKARTGSALIAQQNQIRNVFWGIDHNTLPAAASPSSAMPGIGAEFITRNFNNRYGYRSVRAVTSRAVNGVNFPSTPMQFFNVNRHVVKRINVSINEGPFTSWNYTPKSGLIMAQNYGIMPTGGFFDTGTVYNLQDHKVPRWRPSQTTGGVTITGARGVQLGQTVSNAVHQVGNTYNDIFRSAAGDIQGFTSMLIDDPFIGGSACRDIPPLIIGLDPQIGIVEATSAVSAVPCHVDIIVTASIELEITEGVPYDESNYGLQQEIDYKYPSYRMHTVVNQSGLPLVLSGNVTVEHAINSELSAYTQNGSVDVPPTWTYPAPVANLSATDVEDHQATADKELKEAIDDAGKEKLYPYVTRASVKKHIETLKKENDEKKNSRAKRSIAILSDVVLKKGKRNQENAQQILIESDYELEAEEDDNLS